MACLRSHVCTATLGVEEDPATGSACAASSKVNGIEAWIFMGWPDAFRSSKASPMGRWGDIEVARGSAITRRPFACVGGAITYNGGDLARRQSCRFLWP